MNPLRAAAWAVLVAAAGAVFAAEHGGGPDDPVREGEFLFRIYCRACHGDAARGDGPAADSLVTPPADLTRIAARNDGVFPADRVARKIDGRAEVSEHGPSEMPVWGLALQQRDADSDQEEAARRKILQLVAYLESLQRPAED